MESKKINQLATELAPVLSDLTIIGDPTTGISKKITLSQMASLFTGTVEEYPNLASFPLVGTADTIYIALDTNIIYRWNTGTSAYVELSPNIVTSLVFSDANGFDGTISLVGSTATLTITTALTTGSVPFIGASGALSQDNANLFFDDTNNRLGINTNSPTTALDVLGSGIIGRINGTSTNNAFLGFASAGTNKWSIGNVQSDHRFRIYNEATTSELVSVLQTGEFGIGIANPTTKLHIDGGANALIANLDANVSVAKSISFRSDNSNRINLEVSGTESGSNAGANFFLRAYSDAGALLNTPLTITRSTGDVALIGSLNFSGANPSIYMNGSAIDQTALISNANGSNTILKFKSSSFIWSNSDDVERARIKTDGSIRITGGGATTSATLELSSSATPSGGGNISVSYLGTGSYGPLSFATGGSTKMTLTGSGNLGIGTETPDLKLSINGAMNLRNSTRAGAFEIDSSGNLWLGTATTLGNIYFETGHSTTGLPSTGTARLTITGSGNVGIGITPYNWNSIFIGIDFINKGGVHSYTNYLALSQNLYYGSGALDGWRYKTSGYGAGITLESDSGAIVFRNTSSSGTADAAASTFSERMRIANNGNTAIGFTDTTLAKLFVSGYGTPNSLMTQPVLSASSGANAVQLGSDGTHALIGAGNSGSSLILLSRASGEYTQAIVIASNNTVKINNLGTGTVYSNSGVLTNTNPSDKNLKENITDLSFGLNEILKLRPVSFDWKNNPKNQSTQYGFIAQEVQKILPQLVNEFDSFEDEQTEISIKRLGLDKDAIFVSLVKAIQEQQAQIEELKALISK